GRVLQSGPPERVFREPASPYIAEFLGAENVLAGTVHHLRDSAPDWTASQEDGDLSARGKHAIEFRAGPLTLYTVGDAAEGPGHAVIRAEEILLSVEPHPSSARNVFRGRILEVASSGALTRVTVDVQDTPLIAALTTRSADELGLAPGQEIHASFKAMAVHLC
ncbi:MAG TPA: TOBE domain-containing protein, partial [Gemmatimonadaceae bacterium]|nr:TOBE domain-containing protein [Gemmatimonadaceae bacterium]